MEYSLRQFQTGRLDLLRFDERIGSGRPLPALPLRVSEVVLTPLEYLLEEPGPFRRVRECAVLEKAQPYEGTFYAGLDWAMSNDFTVITVLDANTRKVVDQDRFNKIDWSFQRSRVKAMADKWKVTRIIAERNSIGGPNIEALQREGLPVQAFDTTATSKPPLIESLALAFERGEIQILNDPVTLGELEAYERIVSPTTGRSSYNAPHGWHDDTVISLALAWYGAQNTGFRIYTLYDKY